MYIAVDKQLKSQFGLIRSYRERNVITKLSPYECISSYNGDIQRGPKARSLVALSSRGRCAQHLRRIRGFNARIRRILCHAGLVPVVSHLRISLHGISSVCRRIGEIKTEPQRMSRDLAVRRVVLPG
jgi:hypothetical protein